jgi:hypothetical protein
MLQAFLKRMRFPLTLTLLTLATLTGVYVLLGNAEVRDFNLLSGFVMQPAMAQFTIPQEAWKRVYERVPDLPKENQYISRETGKVDENNTLVTRLMRYHVFVKRRPPMYRLDWKLTLADYLGAHEYLEEDRYPSADTLQQNPAEGDRQAVQKLTRAQRDALVNAIVSVFNPNSTQSPAPTPRETQNNTPEPPPTPSPRATPSLPQPGDAQLLMP